MATAPSIWRHVYRRLRQARCPHRVRAADIQRIDENRVEVTCLRCGKVLSAPYGLALDATDWVK